MANSNSPEAAIRETPVRVWDLPLRIFHWSLVTCILGSFVTVKTGNMNGHFLFGYTALTLILFRLLWGLFGPRYARFASFPPSPGAVLAYLRDAPQAIRTLGHTPLGALSVYALLALVLLQASTGLFSHDDIASEGPLARLVSNATVERATSFHHTNQLLILAMIGLHLAAIAFYAMFRNTALVGPMIDGDKKLEGDPASLGALAARDDAGIRLRAVLVLGIAIALVAVIVNWPVL